MRIARSNFFKSLCLKATSNLLLLTIVCTLFSVSPVNASTDYEDVSYEHWAYSYISHCKSEGLMLGTSQNTFSPDSTISVAEAITVAVRLSGKVPEVMLKQNTGGNWYDAAVSIAKSIGIIYENQFESYTRPALRAELAFLLASVRPEADYEPINNITFLPDVDYATIYNKEIYKLYNAGILTGSDNRGTFYPYNNITRAEASAIICRVSNKYQRKTFHICSQPYGSLSVLTTGCRVNIGGIYSYGVVSIGGKFFISPATLELYYKNSQIDFSYYTDKYYSVSIYKNDNIDVSTVYDNYFIQPAGIVLGTAEVSNKPLQYKYRDYYGAVCTLGSEYVFFSLEALGAKQEGFDFIIPIDFEVSGRYYIEQDYVGYALPTLQRQTQKNTVLAIHDYIVNTLTYNPLVAVPPGVSQATLDAIALAEETAKETYKFNSNITLATKYGICQDYAELFNNMCNRIGIPCVIVTGGAMGLDGYDSHAWNRVYIDGAWHFVDTTFDDPVSSKPVLEHSYFMISANKLANTHVWYGYDYPMPDEYDPAWEQIDPNNVKSADEFRKCLVAQLMLGKNNIRIKGVYGGLACIYSYQTYFSSFSGGYNSSSNSYEFNVKYFWDY